MRLPRRPRRRPGHDPETISTLAALDAALAGDRVDAEHADLREFAVALREERPRPRPEFELALDLRAHEGFSRDSESGIHRADPARRRELHTPQRLRTTPLALGTAAALFIVATAVFTTGLLGGEGRDSGTTASAPPGKASPAGDAAGGGAAGAVPQAAAAPEGSPAGTAESLESPLPPSGIAPGARRRQVERAAEITLSTPRSRIEDVADDVIRVTDRHGGFVLNSSVSTGDRGDAGASLELRIPAARLPAAVADLSELGHVRSRTQSARDITAQFSSPRRRLADALAERRGLLRQLARADTPNETAAVRARLRAVNRRADRARRELRALRERASFAAVSVAVEPGAREDTRGDGAWSLGDAARDALDVLGAIAGATIVALAVAVPAGLLAGLAWLAWRAVLRRRRERALDAAPLAAPPAAD